MKRSVQTCLLVFVLGLVAQQAIGQSTGDYRSNVSPLGSWTVAASWQRFNGTAWVAAPAPPSSTDGVITILNADRILVSSAITIDQVVIASGGQLTIALAGVVVADGAGNDIENNGILTLSNTSTFSGTGNVVNNSGGTFTVNNTSVLSVSTVNNGIMQVFGTVDFSGNTVINNATFALLDFTLNLNNATFINRGLVNLDYTADSFIDGTGGGVFTNEGTIFKTTATGTAWIDPDPGTVTFTNNGIVKGSGTYIFRSAASNTGAVTPGNNGAGTLTVNPAFVTGRTPTFNLDIVSTGAVAGTNYDRVSFSNTDAATTNISGAILDVSDNASDAIGTVYTLVTSTSTIAGTFATVHLAPTLGNLTYNANSITVQKLSSQNLYVWSGGNSAWTTAANWTPSRTTPAATDILTFNTGTTVTVTNVPTESISALTVTNNTTVNLQSSASSKNLTVGNGYMNYLNIDPGSTLLVLNNAGIVLNIFIANGSRAAVGGIANMQNGNFNIGDNILQLHTTAVPLLRTSGQFAIGSNGSIEFGDPLHTTGSAMTLTNSIFVAPPVIASVTVNRTNGAVLGNQSITVNQAKMTLGDLTTNASGRILFSTTAANPAESSSSKIIGYAELMPRTVGTAALNFLGAASPAGSDIGTFSLTRVTGPAGINTFNGFNSIAATWNIAVTIEPSPARTVTFSWLSDFDNGANTSLLFQDYRYDIGPGWVAVGPLAALQSAGNPRSTMAVSTLKFTGAWTISDQLNVLPIVLGGFDGKQVDNTIVLNWKTLSELNGDYFEVQRRDESEETFSVLGTVTAHGTSREVIRYSFVDEHPVKGINYYRLKLVDFDQSFDYSSVISVPYEPGADFVIYPNPTTGREVTLVFAEDSNGLISVFDMTHRKILTRLVGGYVSEVTLSDLSLSAGAYIITYESKGQRIVKKLLVRP